MISTRRIGRVLVWIVVLVPFVFWVLGGGMEALPRGRHGAWGQGALAVGQVAGLTGMALLSMAFVLSTRIRLLEDYFGGLDDVYRFHHQLGLAAFGVLLLHPVALALRFLPVDPARILTFLLPGHARLSVEAGVYAFWLLVLLLVVTLTSWVPYDDWKRSHKGLGLVLLGGGLHMWFLEGTPGQNVAVTEQVALRYYMTVLVGLGLAAGIYKTIVLPLWPKPGYTVTDVTRLNEDVLEVKLTPQDASIDFVPGQFVFVTFHDDALSRESHPYTLCNHADADTLAVTVKALGDYTSRLYERLESGIEATLEGPYGRFNYRDGGPRQIWIAGGVGVAPFLSWIRDLARRGETSLEVEFYYCVHDRSDAVYRDEFERLSGQLSNVHVALVCSVEDGHFHARDVDDVEGADVFMCGPKRLTRDLRRQFRERGLPDARIRYEDFEFR